MKKAVCLLSGGLDSATTAAIAKSTGYELYCLSFDYGQKHKKELLCARKIAKALKAKEHKIVKIDLRKFGGSALTSRMKVPLNRKMKGIPSTYVPARNTIMLSIALAYAEAIDAGCIYIGANCVDYSGYPDCRPEYYRRMQKAFDVATKKTVSGKRIRIQTPIIKLRKAEIIRKALMHKVPLQHTWSCYKGGKLACGRCDSCRIRLSGFKEAGKKDVLRYEK